MASLGAGIVSALVLVLCMVVPSLATVYTIGDSTGWTMGVDYSTWTSDKTFKVGDSLVFNYGGGHTVDEVSASDYNTCTVGNALTSDKSGATTVALKTAGAHYFICGVVGHCGSGMKLAVTVAAAGSPTTTPSSSGTSTTTNTTTTTPSSTTTSPSSSTGTTSTNKPSTLSESSSVAISPFLTIMVTLVASFVMVYS